MTILNYQNAVAEEIPFIWQKIERNLTSVNDCTSSLRLILLLVKHTHFGFHNHHYLHIGVNPGPSNIDNQLDATVMVY
jgi:hypothetical protein